jgi:hypothetical protein
MNNFYDKDSLGASLLAVTLLVLQNHEVELLRKLFFSNQLSWSYFHNLNDACNIWNILILRNWNMAVDIK